MEKIQNAYRDINLEGLNIKGGSSRNLNMHKFTRLEKANRKLDVITGFELIDSELRMYVFEGLSNGAMKKILKYMPILQPNCKELTILKNQSIRFQERLYTDFEMRIQMIKLRQPLR